MGSMDFRTDQRQQQALSPKLQHAVRLLQLSSLDFAQEVNQALGRNPFLEVEEADDGIDIGSLSDTASAPDDAAADRDAEQAGDSDREVWQADALSRQRHADSDDTSALELMAAQVTLARSEEHTSELQSQ